MKIKTTLLSLALLIVSSPLMVFADNYLFMKNNTGSILKVTGVLDVIGSQEKQAEVEMKPGEKKQFNHHLVNGQTGKIYIKRFTELPVLKAIPLKLLSQECNSVYNVAKTISDLTPSYDDITNIEIDMETAFESPNDMVREISFEIKNNKVVATLTPLGPL